MTPVHGSVVLQPALMEPWESKASVWCGLCSRYIDHDANRDPTEVLRLHVRFVHGTAA